MSFNSQISRMIDHDWNCIGQYGYGNGASKRYLEARFGQPVGEISERPPMPCSMIHGSCRHREQCLRVHTRAADLRWTRAAEIGAEVVKENTAKGGDLDEESCTQIFRVRLYLEDPAVFAILPPGLSDAMKKQIVTHYELLYAENFLKGAGGEKP